MKSNCIGYNTIFDFFLSSKLCSTILKIDLSYAHYAESRIPSTLTIPFSVRSSALQIRSNSSSFPSIVTSFSISSSEVSNLTFMSSTRSPDLQ